MVHIYVAIWKHVRRVTHNDVHDFVRIVIEQPLVFGIKQGFWVPRKGVRRFHQNKPVHDIVQHGQTVFQHIKFIVKEKTVNVQASGRPHDYIIWAIVFYDIKHICGKIDLYKK
jgi:hypothetical protein